jgi:hypothetical protein
MAPRQQAQQMGREVSMKMSQATKSQRKALLVVRRFEAATRAHEMRGGQRLEDVPAIEAEYDAAKLDLLRLLKVERTP